MTTKRTKLGATVAQAFERRWMRQDERGRKLVTITLGDDARDKLARLALLHGVSRSEMVEALIHGAPTLED